MSDTEKEAFRQIGINLINEYRQQRGLKPIDWLVIDNPEASAFIRSIQLHEKTKQELADFKQEVSDVAETLTTNYRQSFLRKYLGHFIISKPKPDELVEVWGDLFEKSYNLDQFCAALEARGFEIREKGQ